MILITRGASNTFAVTLKEKQTLSNPYFLLRVVSEGKNTESACIITDTSNYTQRYNLFTITEGTDITISEGINVYYIYEQSSAVNTDYRNATTLLETGLMKATGTATESFSQPTYTETFSWQTTT